MMKILDLETDYKGYVSQPAIEVNTDWFLPLAVVDYWDTSTEVLRNMGVSESLADSFTHRLVIECMRLVEEDGKVRPDSGIVDIFGTIALETLEGIRSRVRRIRPRRVGSVVGSSNRRMDRKNY